MRKITADYILHPNGALQKNSTLIMDGRVVVDLISEIVSDSETHEGIILPGFINSHCHLELSHLENKIPSGKKLHGFIHDIIPTRKKYSDNIFECIETSDQKMWENGIQAVGDICNEAISFSVKAKSKIRYHNFIELFSRNDLTANEIIRNGLELCEKSNEFRLHASIIPHAPYSVTPELFTEIKNIQQSQHALWCIHNQETESENEMFLTGEGALTNAFRAMGIDRSWFNPSKKKSLPTIGEYFPDSSNLLFVHNTFTQTDDIEFLDSQNFLSRSWFAICSKANLFIENKLPDIAMFIRNNCKLVIGTDSLASNDSLSIFEEIKTIHHNFPEIKISYLLQAATQNGADYFKWNDLGSFKKGATPGVIHLSECNDIAIGSKAKVKRLI